MPRKPDRRVDEIHSAGERRHVPLTRVPPTPTPPSPSPRVLPLLSIEDESERRVKESSTRVRTSPALRREELLFNRPPDVSSSSRVPRRILAEAGRHQSTPRRAACQSFTLGPSAARADSPIDTCKSGARFRARVAISGLRFQVKILIAESRRFPHPSPHPHPTTPSPSSLREELADALMRWNTRESRLRLEFSVPFPESRCN